MLMSRKLFSVRAHHVSLPDEFLERIRGSDCVMPPEDLSILMEIVKDLRGRL